MRPAAGAPTPTGGATPKNSQASKQQTKKETGRDDNPMMSGTYAGMTAMMIASGVLYLALLTLAVLGIVWLTRTLRTGPTRPDPLRYCADATRPATSTTRNTTNA
jgi:hypothetical protein